jgi:hypothetical protein
VGGIVGRVLLSLVAVALAAGCAHSTGSGASAPSASASSGSSPIHPDRIKRVRGDLPPGYEVADVEGAASPAQYWGFRPGWTADRPQCAALVNPVADPLSAQGLSGSGAGGIVYVVVVTARSETAVPDAGLVADCGQWSLDSGGSSATVNLVDAPRIDAAGTVALSTAIRTVVESGTQTDAQAQTATAYVGRDVVFVTVITDPGSPDPPLPPQYAGELLVKAVSALRG